MSAPSNKGMPRKLVLDGGFATELERAGFGIHDDPLWSARYLQKSPEAVKAVHTSFLESGADIIITATYQASVGGFQEHLGLDAEQSLELIKQGTVLAQEAINEFWEKCSSQHRRKPLVAGSVGPYGACQHDGSEYTGNYVDSMSIEELMDWHRPRIKVLVDSQVDILALETIPAQKEGEALALLLKEFPDITAWLTFSCKDAQLTCHGEQFADAVAAAVQHTSQIIATGVNCCSPLVVQPLLQAIHGKINLPFVVYPNSGENWDRETGWHNASIKIDCLASYIPRWIDSGACWIGGCCRTTPPEIAEIRKLLDHYQDNSKPKLSTTEKSCLQYEKAFSDES